LHKVAAVLPAVAGVVRACAVDAMQSGTKDGSARGSLSTVQLKDVEGFLTFNLCLYKPAASLLHYMIGGNVV
jgi:hypothetical protein